MNTSASYPRSGLTGTMPGDSATIPLRAAAAVALCLGAAVCFHLAYHRSWLAWLMVPYLVCLMELRRLPSSRQAFYAGLTAGLGVFVPQLFFLWEIFKYAALPLWLILAAWHGLFVLLLKHSERRWGIPWTLVLAPVFWTGLEYFRSELYYLRFAWITPGGAFDSGNWLRLPGDLGIYGAGCLVAILGALFVGVIACGKQGPKRGKLAVIATTVLWFALTFKDTRPSSTHIEVAGLQLEMTGVPEVMAGLKRMAALHPQARLLVLSEYTFDGPVPETVLEWCRRNDRYLIAGGKEPLPGKQFRNTVFVVGPEGQVVFSQAKAVPIQFFDDGLPAEDQRVWNSPWGTIGICVCYDLSFSRVVDHLARLGARAIIVPTMDVEQWGAYQHELHRRITRIRAAEYRLPIMRLASSGISQIVNREGVEEATAPFPGQGEIIHGFLQLEQRAAPRLPPDRILAPACVGFTGLAALVLVFQSWRDRRRSSAAGAFT